MLGFEPWIHPRVSLIIPSFIFYFLPPLLVDHIFGSIGKIEISKKYKIFAR